MHFDQLYAQIIRKQKKKPASQTQPVRQPTVTTKSKETIRFGKLERTTIKINTIREYKSAMQDNKKCKTIENKK